MRTIDSIAAVSGLGELFLDRAMPPRRAGAAFSVERMTLLGDAAATPGDSALAGPLPPRATSDFPAVIDLTGLPLSAGFVIRGDAAGDFTGIAVSTAGDINGDGFDEIIIGALRGDDGGVNAGEAYVIFGKASGFGAIDLTTLSPSEGFIIQGDMGGVDPSTRGDYAGRAVSTAGDINGDGFDDIIVGAPNGDDGGINAGEAYVIFGKAAGFSNIDLSLLGTAEGFVIRGAEDDDYAGASVSSAGDINGDGLDDIIIGARNNDGGGDNAGAAYVIFGRTTPFTNIDLASFDGNDGFIIQGAADDDNAGVDVASAGDVNGDGFDDLFVSATGADEGGLGAGVAYVVFGKAEPFGTIDLAVLGTAEGFRIIGDAADDFAGFSIATAGDMNGDGLDDMIVGAPGGDDAGTVAGEAYVVFGREGIGTIDLTTFNPADPNHDPAAGFIIRGDAAADYAGFDVSSAGDVNGDGFDDVIVGAPLGDNGGDRAGEAYVLFGKAAGFGLIDLTVLDVEQGFIIQGDAGGVNMMPGDYAGAGVSSAGDVNGDGFDDILVGAPAGDDGGTDAGEAYVIFGRAPTAAANRTGSAASQAILGGAFNDTLKGLAGDDTLDGRGGADSLVGGADDDSLLGGAGIDTLDGGGGADTLDGGAGRDWADYSKGAKVRADLKAPQLNSDEALGDVYVSIENLRGTNGKDRLSGDDANNRIEGLDKADVIGGRNGNDTLAGGLGKDKLKGGDGADRFEFAELDDDDVDKIIDFVSGTDEIALVGAVFGLPTGALANGAFVIAAVAQDANDRLIYRADSGKLFFDPDGTGAQAQVQIATLTGAPTLSAADFIVI